MGLLTAFHRVFVAYARGFWIFCTHPSSSSSTTSTTKTFISINQFEIGCKNRTTISNVLIQNHFIADGFSFYVRPFWSFQLFVYLFTPSSACVCVCVCVYMDISFGFVLNRYSSIVSCLFVCACVRVGRRRHRRRLLLLFRFLIPLYSRRLCRRRHRRSYINYYLFGFELIYI